MSKTFKDGKNRAKVRKFWGEMNPMTRIRQSAKNYSRKNWHKDLAFSE